MNDAVLTREERVVFALRDLYRRYGYRPYRMSKFEEYELYVRNKEFMVGDRVIAFNDTNGKMLALKPDVTLSIIKGGEDRPGEKQKVYYDENVYRVSKSTHRFKEIRQAGLECIGAPCVLPCPRRSGTYYLASIARTSSRCPALPSLTFLAAMNSA